MPKAYRNSASFGKRQEYVAVAKLLQEGFDVYMTLVDDQQIDCVVRLGGREPRYLDVQIKARSKQAKYPGYFAGIKIEKPRKNYFFIFYDEVFDTHWVIPSLHVVSKGNRNKSGKNEGTYSLMVINKTSGNKRPKFQEYENNFDLLKRPYAARAKLRGGRRV